LVRIAKFRLHARLGAIAFVALTALAPAAGATSICGSIRMQLNSDVEVIGNTAETRAYQRAIQRQQGEIAKVRSDMARYRCNGGSILMLGGANAGACDMLSDTLERMYDNLADLQNHDARVVSHSMSRKRRAQLLDALERNGCNDVPDTPRAEIELTPAEPASYQHDDSEPVAPEGQRQSIRNLGGGDRGGNLQTVCVRTCDGGFFPLSSNTSTGSFERDAQVCSMMCPGVETELFYHGIGTQEMVDMVSANGGTPYKEEPYAFRFRDPNRKPNKSCGCNFSAYYRDMMKRQAARPGSDPDPQQDAAPAETTPKKQYSSIVNLDAKPEAMPEAKPTGPASQPAPIAKEASKTELPPARPYDPAHGNVRQVGPQFLPGKDTAIDLRHPSNGGAN
jgi:hypothetical protein